MKSFILFFAAALSLEISAKEPFAASKNVQAKPPIRLACVGDSITQGAGAEAGFSYPSQLQTLLGKRWKVENFGVGGRTLLKKGDLPYWREDAYQKALKSSPNIVIIMLGTNDSKPQNWRFEAEFIADYSALIESFEALPSRPRIYVCRPCPVVEPGAFGISRRIVQEEIKRINRLAAKKKLAIIDMDAALRGKPELIPDTVHPNTAGALLMAKAAANAITRDDLKKR